MNRVARTFAYESRTHCPRVVAGRGTRPTPNGDGDLPPSHQPAFGLLPQQGGEGDAHRGDDTGGQKHRARGGDAADDGGGRSPGEGMTGEAGDGPAPGARGQGRHREAAEARAGARGGGRRGPCGEGGSTSTAAAATGEATYPLFP
jgi:hypothetical protein